MFKRALPALLVGAWAALNLWLARDVIAFQTGGSPDAWYDFRDLYAVSHAAGNPYILDYRWSPLALPLLWLATEAGRGIWIAAHFGLAALVRPWWLAVALVMSYPFIFDAFGQVMTLVVVLGWLALRGNRWAAYATFALALLMPRPLMLPIVLWLLWRQPATRRPFAVILAANVVGVALSGLGPAWLAQLASTTSAMGSPFDWGPSQLIGGWWPVLGLPLGALLLWRGRVGLAALAVQPYWYPQYFLVLLWEFSGQHQAIGHAERARQIAGRAGLGERHNERPVPGAE